MCKDDMEMVMRPYYAALDYMKRLNSRNGKDMMPDDYYVAYLMSFTDMRHRPSAERTVKEWRSQSEIMRVLDNLYRTFKATKKPEEEIYKTMAYGLYSFGEVRPIERAERAVTEWRSLRRQKP